MYASLIWNFKFPSFLTIKMFCFNIKLVRKLHFAMFWFTRNTFHSCVWQSVLSLFWVFRFRSITVKYVRLFSLHFFVSYIFTSAYYSYILFYILYFHAVIQWTYKFRRKLLGYRMHTENDEKIWLYFEFDTEIDYADYRVIYSLFVLCVGLCNNKHMIWCPIFCVY